MRIGIVTTWQERGAAYVSRQYRDLLKEGHEVFIYARGGENYAIGDKNWDDAKVTWGKKIPIHVPMAIDLADFKNWLLGYQIALVFFNEQQWWDPVLLCQKMEIITGAYIDYYTKETIPFFKIYDFLICNTQRHFSVFNWHPGAVYLPWGTDINLFKPKTNELVSPNTVTFFHSAGLSPERKGTDILLQSFCKTRGNAKLIIHTQTDLTAAHPALTNTINNLLEQKKLIIYNKTITAPGLYHLGDVYVYPSRLDGVGLTLAEAISCGLAIITSDNPPMNEFISPSFGRLIKIASFEKRTDDYYWPMCEPEQGDLSQQLQYYIDNPKIVEDHKKIARIYAENKLNWKNNNQQLLEIFIKLKASSEDKKIIIRNIREYEKKRSNFRTKLYRQFPIIYKPFSWLWPLIKNFYINKV